MNAAATEVNDGPGVATESAARPAPSPAETTWLMTVGGERYEVRYWRPAGCGLWLGTCRHPALGVGVSAHGLTLEICEVRMRLEIAARTGVTL